MLRAYVVILIVYGAFVVHGCAGVDQPDRDVTPKTVAEEPKGTRDELWIEKERVRLENVELQRQIAVLSTENERIVRECENRMVRLKTLNQLLNKEIEELKDVNQTVASEYRLLKGKLSQLQGRREPIAHEQKAAKADISSLKIKVLSGDGDIQSAKQMAGRLTKMGYRIKVIDLAPRKTFQRHTVFFAPNFEKDANRLVTLLSGRTISKPLTWPSVFDCIVVTGKRP